MKKYDYVLFDLDGTLTDPCAGITKSVQYSLEKFGIHAELEELKKFIGPPLVDSFMKYFGFDEPTANEAVVKYREYYSVHGIFDNKIYEGIAGMLAKLEASGSEIILATSKPLVFAEKILEHFSIKQHFTCCFGADLPGLRVKKCDIIEDALKAHPIDVTKAVMVGDRDLDIIGGHTFGMKAIGVLFGYGSREELEGCGADYLAATVAELEALLLD